MRLTLVKLADPDHRLPMPDRGGRPFSADGESVDLDAPFWLACLADGSIVEAKTDAAKADAGEARPDAGLAVTAIPTTPNARGK